MLAERRRKGIRVTDGEMQAVLALVRRAATVDPENPGAAEAAFDALLTPEIPLLYRFIRARVSSDQVAEDLLQETMLGAWRQLGNFDGRSRFGTWLLAIAKYRVIDWQRRESRQRPAAGGLVRRQRNGSLGYSGSAGNRWRSRHTPRSGAQAHGAGTRGPAAAAAGL